MALSTAAKEAIYLMRIMDEIDKMGFKIRNEEIVLKCTVKEDNSGAVELARENKFRPRTRHINTKYWHFMDWVNGGRVEIEQVSTEKQLADIWTKPLGTELFQKHQRSINKWDALDMK